MQIFANGKQRFYSFMEFYVIHLRNEGVKILSYSTTLNSSKTLTKRRPLSKKNFNSKSSNSDSFTRWTLFCLFRLMIIYVLQKISINFAGKSKIHIMIAFDLNS